VITTTTLKPRAVVGNDSSGFIISQLVGLECAETPTCGLPTGELAWNKPTGVVVIKIDDERPSYVDVIPALLKDREAGLEDPNTTRVKLATRSELCSF
jgi:hypothetical protein